MSMFQKVFGTHSEREVKRIKPLVDQIEALRPTMQALSDEDLRNKTTEFKERLSKGETLDDLLPEAFAVVREADKRVLGMEPYRVQLIGGIILHQGLTFTGLHLGDAALMQHNAADKLHPVGTQTQHPVRCLPDGGEGLGENVVGGLPVLQPLLKLGGLCLKLGVGEGFILLLQRLDLVGNGIDFFQLVVAICTENLGKQAHI